jgi:hypothetical protein
MTRGEPVVGNSQEAPVVVPEPRRDRVVVRRRRAHSRHRHGKGRWTAAHRSRRRVIRAMVLCVTVLLMMAAGLYLTLSRQDVAPVETRLHAPMMLALSGAHS